MNDSLKGFTVVNTRPAHQAETLSDLVRQSGGNVIEFPVIEIQPPPDTEKLKSKLFSLSEADLAIFVSANAVDAAMNIMGGAESWPDNVSIASVGQATALKLESAGLVAESVAPDPFNSEALLSMPEMENVSNKNILIFRGQGGREFLAESLRAGGANVEYIECYRRVQPSCNPAELNQCWEKKQNCVFVVTSNEGMHNLLEMVTGDQQKNLLASTLVVVSERAVQLAKKLGFSQNPVLSKTVTNASIVDAILRSQTIGK